MTTESSPHPWSEEALFGKALLYVEQMDSHTANDWQFGLWSALSLELLARAALARISPVLLADARNWRNLTHAIGAAPTARKFSPTSVSAKEVFDRLQELIPEFTKETADFCTVHSGRRNSELHTGELAFTSLGTSEWLPRYYAACEVLLRSMGKDLSSFLSDADADADAARAMIASLADTAAKAVERDIKAQARFWSDKNEEERKEALARAAAWATRHAGHRVNCPACGSPALVQGNPSGTVTTDMNGDVVVQRQSMLPSVFECIACELRIAGFSKLSACGLGNAFRATSTYSAAEFFDLYTEDDLEEARNELPYEDDFNE